MSVWASLRGVVGAFFNLGGPNGSLLVDRAGARVDVRDSTDAAYQELRSKTPGGGDNGNMVATKAYADSVGSTGAEKMFQMIIGTTPGTFTSTIAFTTDVQVTRVVAQVATIYDGVPTMSVGLTGGGATALMTTAENDLTTLGLYAKDVFTAAGVDTVTVTFARTGGTAVGALTVFVFYQDPAVIAYP